MRDVTLNSESIVVLVTLNLFNTWLHECFINSQRKGLCPKAFSNLLHSLAPLPCSASPLSTLFSSGRALLTHSLSQQCQPQCCNIFGGYQQMEHSFRYYNVQYVSESNRVQCRPDFMGCVKG